MKKIHSTKFRFGSCLLFILILNIHCMAQFKNEINSIQRERLTSQQLKKIIQQKKGVLDTLFTKEYLNDTYLLDNGKVIVDFTTHGYLYSSLVELRQWINHLRDKQNQSSPSHILKDRLLYGEDFISHVDSLVDTVVSIFKLKDSNPSLGNLQAIDAMLVRDKDKFKVTELLFSGLVAYAGEVIKNELSGGKWDLISYKWDTSVWEPYIKLNEKTYNPFFPVYRELYEEYPETGLINISKAIMSEIQK